MSTESETVSNRPTQTSARLALAVGVLAVGLVLWPLRPFVPAVGLSMLGIGALAVAIWLLGRESPTPLNRFAASLLAGPASLGLLGGLVGVVVVLLGTLFPVPTGARVPTAMLRLFAHLGIVLGCVFAVLGLATTVRDVLTPAPLARFSRSALICGTIPTAVGAALAGTAMVFQADGAGSPTILSRPVDATVAPAGPGLHLGSFLFALAAGFGGVWLLAYLVPYEDALADAGFAPAERARLSRVLSVVTVVAVGSGVLFPVVTVVELSAGAGGLQRTLGPGLAGLVRAVTTLVALRYLLVALALGSTGAALVATLARVGYGRRATTAGWLAPASAGAVLTLLTGLFAVDLYNRTVAEITARLPQAVATPFLDITSSTRLTYGEPAIVIVAVGALTLFAAGISYGFRGLIALGYISRAGGGYTLAAGGLLVAGANAGGLGLPVAVVFACVLAALLVWDIGHYGVDLGRTIAPGPTRPAELVHAGASALVGLGAVVVAIVLGFGFTVWTVDPSPARVLALVCLVVGLAALVVAARR